ncbi:MAG: hypothetical protein PEGG_02051 [Paraeggerthella hongkongensis]
MTRQNGKHAVLQRREGSTRRPQTVKTCQRRRFFARKVPAARYAAAEPGSTTLSCSRSRVGDLAVRSLSGRRLCRAAEPRLQLRGKAKRGGRKQRGGASKRLARFFARVKRRTLRAGCDRSVRRWGAVALARRHFMFEKRSTAFVKLSMVLSASPCSMPSRTQCWMCPSRTTCPHL